MSCKRSEICFHPLNLIFGRIFGIRPEWGRDGRTGRTHGTDGTDGRAGRTGRTYGPDGTDGRDGRTGRTGWTDGNTVLEYCWDGEIQFYTTIGTEKYSVQS